MSTEKKSSQPGYAEELPRKRGDGDQLNEKTPHQPQNNPKQKPQPTP